MKKITMIATKNFVGKYGDVKKDEKFEIDENELPLYKFLNGSKVSNETENKKVDLNESTELNHVETKVVKEINKKSKSKKDE